MLGFARRQKQDSNDGVLGPPEGRKLSKEPGFVIEIRPLPGMPLPVLGSTSWPFNVEALAIQERESHI